MSANALAEDRHCRNEPGRCIDICCTHMTQGKLLVIDGVNIVRRVYEASTEPESPEKAALAIRNSASFFGKLLSIHEPTHVLPAFDFGGRTWRHDLHPPYREHGASMPPLLHERMPELYELLSGRGLHVLSVPGVDANDVIATVVMRWLGEGRGDAIIASTSRSTLPLIGHGALVWDPFKSEWRDSKWMMEKFGVPPEMMTDLLALVGDSTHAIPGVSKVGLKTAAKLLQSYQTLEGVMGGAGILKNPLGEKLRKERDQAFLSRELVKLKTDVRLGITWKMLASSAAQ
jgi:DNA polymerase-1